MKLKILNLGLLALISGILVFNINVLTENTSKVTGFKSILEISNSFAAGEDPPPPPEYELYIQETDGSCFDCESDPLGWYEVICDATEYNYWCIETENGDENCTEYSELDCPVGNCSPTGRDC